MSPACVTVTGSTLKAPALQTPSAVPAAKLTSVWRYVCFVLRHEGSSLSFAEQPLDRYYPLSKGVDILLHT